MVFQRVFKKFSEGDVRFTLRQKYYILVGIISTKFSKLLYGPRFTIKSTYKIWGKINIIIHGKGSIKIDDNFHAVSSWKRSFLTLFAPIKLTIIGDGKIIIGRNVGLNGTTITSRERIEIGDFTMIGPNTIIVDHDGHPAWPISDRWTQLGPIAPVIIMDNVWIGMNCIILKGVTIGEGAIIAAGSIVISNVEANCIYAGNPAKKIKYLAE